jgi:membrane fusion protein, multidrug efflux system
MGIGLFVPWAAPDWKAIGMLMLSAAAALTGCHGGEAAPARRAVEVGVVTVTPRSVIITTELPGRTSSYRVAEVRPQVGGVLLNRLFVEGNEVKAGQPLYQIDPAPFQASYDSAKATLEHAQAELTTAKLLEERYKPLVEANAVSRQTDDNAVASALQAEADVASGKAAVETARINLAYTHVVSPITGRTSRSSVTEGALVTANQTTALVTVTQLDPMYVDVTQPATVLLRLQVLVGAPLPEELSHGPPLEAQSFLEELPAGLPSDLLERRPDILSAEHNLRAANATSGRHAPRSFPA